MVGLRWWNQVDDDGKSHWVFESRKVLFYTNVHRDEKLLFGLLFVLAFRQIYITT